MFSIGFSAASFVGSCEKQERKGEGKKNHIFVIFSTIYFQNLPSEKIIRDSGAGLPDYQTLLLLLEEQPSI